MATEMPLMRVCSTYNQENNDFLGNRGREKARGMYLFVHHFGFVGISGLPRGRPLHGLVVTPRSLTDQDVPPCVITPSHQSISCRLRGAAPQLGVHWFDNLL